MGQVLPEDTTGPRPQEIGASTQVLDPDCTVFQITFLKHVPVEHVPLQEEVPTCDLTEYDRAAARQGPHITIFSPSSTLHVSPHSSCSDI